ncbi:DMT family transporter [Roseomonas sp. PWR1]|uniref:DMT family transporter n=1 Tax=Roseomonas nitratireducens TaxID=2820810 RepID=A0ABS4AP67_9PROT|nr:DMT family transporter [Neoroseomonas nitratireducens]MBP0463057.1 DMT family transporter [Neoroseomonas nitratireducens]
MSESSQDARRRLWLGIFFMCVATTLFPIMNGIVQVLSRTYPSEQIIWARTAGHLAIVLLLVVPRYGIGILGTRRRFAQVSRSLLLLGSTTLFFFAVKDVPLAKAASISFMTPFFVTLLALPMLGEKIDPRRLAAVIVGFLGVLVVIRPGSEVFQPAALLIVGSAFCYAVYQIFTRQVAGIDRPETSVMYSALIGTVVMSFVVPFAWVTPNSIVDVLLMLALGCLGAGGHWCVAKAMTYGQANVISPFQYWQMIGSVAVGYIITGLFPDAFTWLGAGIIIAAGITIAVTESRRR